MTTTEMQNFFQVNLGNILTIVTMVMGGVITWQKVRDKVDEMAARQTKTENEIGELTRMGILTTLNQHERRLTMLESVKDDVSGMKRDIEWIKEKIRALKDTDV